jgi:SNF2 family DNA or RNA helicase
VTRPFIPRPYQELAIRHIINTPKCALFVFMGAGKSAAVLTALDQLSMVEDNIFPCLIIAPLRVANSVWKQETEKWSSLSHLKMSVVTGPQQQRFSALDAKADIYVTNYDNIQWLEQHTAARWPFKTIVADELTRLKGYRNRQGTMRARALAKMCQLHCKRFIGLTGTPAPNGLKDLWGQLWFLDGGERLGRTYTAFEQRWFQRGWDGYSLQPLPHAQKEIQEKISDICLSVDPKDYFDLKAPIETDVFVELPPDARKLYKEMETKMFMEIEKEPIEAFNAASRTNKCSQLANGAVYYEENSKDYKEVHDEKIKALEEIVEEAAGAPILVAYNFRSDLERLKKAFPQGKALDKKSETIAQWNKGSIPILFAHPASAGHGLNLAKGGNVIVFYGLTWGMEEHTQIIERIGPVRQLQEGLDRNVFIYRILARNTIDEDMLERLKTKESVQNVLLKAMKRRG